MDQERNAINSTESSPQISEAIKLFLQKTKCNLEESISKLYSQLIARNLKGKAKVYITARNRHISPDKSKGNRLQWRYFGSIKKNDILCDDEIKRQMVFEFFAGGGTDNDYPFIFSGKSVSGKITPQNYIYFWDIGDTTDESNPFYKIDTIGEDVVSNFIERCVKNKDRQWREKDVVAENLEIIAGDIFNKANGKEKELMKDLGIESKFEVLIRAADWYYLYKNYKYLLTIGALVGAYHIWTIYICLPELIGSEEIKNCGEALKYLRKSSGSADGWMKGPVSLADVLMDAGTGWDEKKVNRWNLFIIQVDRLVQATISSYQEMLFGAIFESNKFSFKKIAIIKQLISRLLFVPEEKIKGVSYRGARAHGLGEGMEASTIGDFIRINIPDDLLTVYDGVGYIFVPRAVGEELQAFELLTTEVIKSIVSNIGEFLESQIDPFYQNIIELGASKILLDTFSHNIGAHSLVAQEELYRAKSEDNLSKNDESLKQILKGEIEFKRFIRRKPHFWGASSGFIGGQVMSFYDIINEFADNHLFLGSIAYSEDIDGVRIRVRVENKLKKEKDKNEFKDVALALFNEGTFRYSIGDRGEGSKESMDDKRAEELKMLMRSRASKDTESWTFIKCDTFRNRSNYEKICYDEEHEELKIKLHKYWQDLHGINVFVPGGQIGLQAFYTILENLLRNAKHFSRDLLCSIIPVNISVKEVRESYEITCYVEHSQSEDVVDKAIQTMENTFKEGLVKKDGSPNLGGTGQTLVCAGYTQGMTPMEIHSLCIKDKSDEIIKVRKVHDMSRGCYLAYSFRMCKGGVYREYSDIKEKSLIRRYSFIGYDPRNEEEKKEIANMQDPPVRLIDKNIANTIIKCINANGNGIDDDILAEKLFKKWLGLFFSSWKSDKYIAEAGIIDSKAPSNKKFRIMIGSTICKHDDSINIERGVKGNGENILHFVHISELDRTCFDYISIRSHGKFYSDFMTPNKEHFLEEGGRLYHLIEICYPFVRIIDNRINKYFLEFIQGDNPRGVIKEQLHNLLKVQICGEVRTYKDLIDIANNDSKECTDMPRIMILHLSNAEELCKGDFSLSELFYELLKYYDQLFLTSGRIRTLIKSDINAESGIRIHFVPFEELYRCLDSAREIPVEFSFLFKYYLINTLIGGVK